jgi:hypothetical protein
MRKTTGIILIKYPFICLNLRILFKNPNTQKEKIPEMDVKLLFKAILFFSRTKPIIIQNQREYL